MKWQQDDIERLTHHIVQGRIFFAMRMLAHPGLPSDSAKRLHHTVSLWSPTNEHASLLRTQLLKLLEQRIIDTNEQQSLF